MVEIAAYAAARASAEQFLDEGLNDLFDHIFPSTQVNPHPREMVHGVFREISREAREPGLRHQGGQLHITCMDIRRRCRRALAGYFDEMWQDTIVIVGFLNST